MRTRIVVALSALLLAPAANAHINLRAATRLDTRVESAFYGYAMRVLCRLGPKGNAGCDYFVHLNGPQLGGFWRGHDAVVKRHGRLRVLIGPWLTYWGRS